MKKKIGITGQAGFVGEHLYATLSLDNSIQLVPFERSFFTDTKALDGFVTQCDVIVHLAAMNRHKDPNIIYSTNLELVEKLIDTCERLGATPHIIFSSSSQEGMDNPYGKSKKEGKE